MSEKQTLKNVKIIRYTAIDAHTNDGAFIETVELFDKKGQAGEITWLAGTADLGKVTTLSNLTGRADFSIISKTDQARGVLQSYVLQATDADFTVVVEDNKITISNTPVAKKAAPKKD